MLCILLYLVAVFVFERAVLKNIITRFVGKFSKEEMIKFRNIFAILSKISAKISHLFIFQTPKLPWDLVVITFDIQLAFFFGGGGGGWNQ